MNTCLTSIQPKFIVISGGLFSDFFNAINDVELYDTEKDKWVSLPKMNEAREQHSSCSLGDTLYILGGLNE